MSTKEKSTGWKVPLIFSAIVIVIVVIGSFFRPVQEKSPTLPAELEERARSISIDLDDEAGAKWKERIVQSASGFTDADLKSGKLAMLVTEALHGGRFDAACFAVIQMRDDKQREKALRNILDSALEQCATLPWAVFSVKGSREHGREMAQLLQERWDQCRRSGQQ